MTQGNTGNQGFTPRVDHSHASAHHLQGKYDAPIVQKVQYGNQSINLKTPVSGTGQVGPTTFGK